MRDSSPAPDPAGEADPAWAPLPRADEALPIRADPGLPRWTLPVAMVGLAVIVVSVMPALVARRRLEAADLRMREDVRRLESEAAHVARERQALATDLYVLDRTVRELMAPGHSARVAARPGP